MTWLSCLGYIEQLSNPCRCVYHGQFGFGDPITDLVLQYVGDDDSIKLEDLYNNINL